MVFENFKNTLTWRFIKTLQTQRLEFLETFGNIGKDFWHVLIHLAKFHIKPSEVMIQAARFAFDSLPITLTIVSMTAIILSVQIAPELVKQGGGDYYGMMCGLVMAREIGAVMAGFAIISMIGSAYASEIASMNVTDQISAMKVLHVDPVEYLIVPRFIAGVLMMPVIVMIASTVGIVVAGAVGNITAEISTLNFITSLWHGLFVKDIFVALLKSSVFGGTIALISCSCGYATRGGAKDVGIATTKAVVWSFLAIAVWDFVFAVVFYM